MEEAANLELDVDASDGGAGEGPRAPLRVKVGSVWAYTRHSGAPVITRNCSSLLDFEREVGRLREELAAILVEGREYFGESAAGAEPPAEPAPGPAAAEAEPAALDLDASARVRDLMTSQVETVSPNDKLRIADELMRAGGFRHAVVLSEEGEVVGVVSQHDLMFAGIAWALGIGRTAHDKALETVLVKEVMSTQVVSIEPEEQASVAASLLFERKIGCLPVVAGTELVGIVTEADFLARFARG